MYLQIFCTPEKFWKHCCEFQPELHSFQVIVHEGCSNETGFHMFSHVWPPQKFLKGLWIQVAENINPVVLQWFQQQPRVLCRGDPPPGASFSYLPQYPWRLFLTTIISSPKIISRWFSFEQPPYFHSKYTEHMQWEESLRVGETFLEYT